MSKRYTLEELLYLRVSPLVVAPEGLAPVEEWMGSQESVVRKGRTDDQNTMSLKRPGLAEFHHLSRRSSTAPEDIVLGPPKTAFSSAHARNLGKQNTPDIDEELESKKDRSSFHERHNREAEGEERDHDRKESRYGGTQSRRIGRDDREEWQHVRARRNHDNDDEGRPKRPGERDRERPKWEPRDPKDAQDGEIDSRRGAREDGRALGRRDVNGRSKLDQPWIRGEKAQESDSKGSRLETRGQDWRRERGKREEWDKDRYGKVEQDPEWMDSNDAGETTQAHTHEDLQKWKEEWKAGQAAGGISEPSSREIATKPEQSKLELAPESALLNTPEINAAMDRFFATFNERPSDQKAAEAKAPKKGRFASLFSPPAEEPAKLLEVTTTTQQYQKPKPAASPAATINDADQAGFQRILQMLGQRSNNTTPQDQTTTKPEGTLALRQAPSRGPDHPHSPIVETRRRDFSSNESPPRHRMSTGVESLLGQISPAKEHEARPKSTSKDTDHLLRLIQQPNNAPDPTQQTQPRQPQPASNRNVPGILQIPQTFNRLFDDGMEQAHNDVYGRHAPTFDYGPLGEPAQRRPTNGHPQPFFDEPFFNELRQTNQPPPQSNPQHAQNRQPNFPPGMQRPPGLDRPPPGWPNPLQMPLQPPHQQGPPSAPPGIPNPPHRGMGPAFPLPQQQMPRQMFPAPPQLPSIPPSQQQQRPRKYTDPAGPGPGPNFPLGMGPPPGFSMNGPPPPGFAGLPPHAGMGGPFDRAGEMQQRFAMDMFASSTTQRNGGRPGPGGPGGGGGGMLGGYQ